MALRINLLLLFLYHVLIVTSAKTLVELDSGNWDKETQGKSLMIIFCTPWCSHCKDIERTWTLLAEKWNKKDDTLIGRVDCDQEKDEICKKYSIVGTPTILYGGDPVNFLEYGGDKDFASLDELAKEVMVPTCGPYNLKACNEKDQESIRKYMAMTIDEIGDMIQGVKDKELHALDNFDLEFSKLQTQYDSLNNEIVLKRARSRNEIRIIKEVKKFIKI